MLDDTFMCHPLRHCLWETTFKGAVTINQGERHRGKLCEREHYEENWKNKQEKNAFWVLISECWHAKTLKYNGEHGEYFAANSIHFISSFIFFMDYSQSFTASCIKVTALIIHTLTKNLSHLPPYFPTIWKKGKWSAKKKKKKLYPSFFLSWATNDNHFLFPFLNRCFLIPLRVTSWARPGWAETACVTSVMGWWQYGGDVCACVCVVATARTHTHTHSRTHNCHPLPISNRKPLESSWSGALSLRRTISVKSCVDEWRIKTELRNNVLGILKGSELVFSSEILLMKGIPGTRMTFPMKWCYY